MTMGEGLLHVHKYLWPSGAGRFHHSLHPMVSAVTLSLLMDHNGITIYDHLMILPGEGLREAWFVSWSRGSQLEPNDGGAGARPRSLVPRPVSGRGGAFLGWPRHGLAWLPVITVTHNAGGDHKAQIDTICIVKLKSQSQSTCSNKPSSPSPKKSRVDTKIIWA